MTVPLVDQALNLLDGPRYQAWRDALIRLCNEHDIYPEDGWTLTDSPSRQMPRFTMNFVQRPKRQRPDQDAGVETRPTEQFSGWIGDDITTHLAQGFITSEVYKTARGKVQDLTHTLINATTEIHKDSKAAKRIKKAREQRDLAQRQVKILEEQLTHYQTASTLGRVEKLLRSALPDADAHAFTGEALARKVLEIIDIQHQEIARHISDASAQGKALDTARDELNQVGEAKIKVATIALNTRSHGGCTVPATDLMTALENEVVVSELEPGDYFVVTIYEMPQADYDALPEFDGF